jgi:hypothetical protein
MFAQMRRPMSYISRLFLRLIVRVQLLCGLFQCSKVGFVFPFAFPAVLVAAGEICDEIALFEFSVFGGCGAVGVGVDEVLGDHGEFGEDCAVPSVPY